MVYLAGANDINDIVELAKELQKEKQLYSDVPIKDEQFKFWLVNCINMSSIEILCSRTENSLDGFMVLSECTYAWNNEKIYGTDLMFLCRKNGHKLVRLAKNIAKKRKWHSLILSTTCNNERADKYMNKISTQIGGVYDVLS